MNTTSAWLSGSCDKDEVERSGGRIIQAQAEAQKVSSQIMSTFPVSFKIRLSFS